MQPNSNWSTNLFLLFLWGVVFLLSTLSLFSQHTISVRVDDGVGTNTCTDGFDGEAEPVWQVNIENEGWITYNDCFESLPNTQFTTTLDCLGDLRGGEVQVCFKVFENDPSILDPCRIRSDCEEQACGFFVLPLPGTEVQYELAIPDGLASGGNVNFTIITEGPADIAGNDHICNAIDLGELDASGTLGKKEVGSYNNYCATALNEVNPKSVEDASFTNNVGVWFSFNTGAQPSELILVEALSDPEEVGDPLSLQLALYGSDTDCRGALTLLSEHHDPSDFNEFLLLECLPPNQTFYLLVDAVYDESTLPDLPLLHGIFSLSLQSLSVIGENDQICDAQLIEVEDGGSNTYQNFFNNCATNTNDPIIDNFPSLHPVWFQFQPPTSRRVKIEVMGNLPYPEGIDPIIPQIVVFEATDNDCSESLSRKGFHYASESPTNTIELDCLDPANTYWLMVDGNEEQPTGIFDITIEDLGYPETKELDTLICIGSQFTLGNQAYTEAGVYTDTVVFESGCLEIYETTIRLADSLSIEVDFPKIAGGEDVEDGIAELNITGGSGNYQITWEDGDDATRKETLIGGATYCVTVADLIGCIEEICFDMPYVIPIQASLKNDTLDCHGYANGQLEVTIEDGRPPYQYTLHNAKKQMIESGTIEDTTAFLVFKNLVADNYTVILNTANAVNTLMGMVESPAPIEVSVLDQNEASCFGVCDGSIQLLTEGGNGDFKFYWDSPEEIEFNNADLCAGSHNIIAKDAKNCTKIFDFDISEPEAFIAKVTESKDVTCFGEEDGSASIITNGNPASYVWDNGEETAQAINLDAGIHTVVVTNEDDCIDTASVEIFQPTDPLRASIEVISEINCFGENTGLLKATSSGGNGVYRLEWNNEVRSEMNDNLEAGTYTVTLTDQQGCTHTTSADLAQPAALSAAIATKDVTCPEGPQSGEININNTTGGTMPYAYRLTDTRFTDMPQFGRLAANTYDVIIQDANGCEWTQTATINNPPPLKLNLGEDQNIKLGKTVQLEAISNRPVSYAWEVPDSINCGDCPSINFRPLTSGQYAVTVTDLESECTATDEIFVTINNQREIFVPNVFSPNADGNNDFLMVYGGSDIRVIKDFKIFNRQGSLVYEASNFTPNDPAQSWRGEYNGQRLAPAVFIYYAEIEFIDGFVDIFSGDFALMR